MLRRYYFLDNKSLPAIYDKVQAAFLAAKDGNEVKAVIDAILTPDEKVKVGRRILVAQLIKDGKITYEDLLKTLKVGKSTVAMVIHQMLINPEGFEAIFRRVKKVDQEYKDKAFATSVLSRHIVGPKTRTNFKRADVKR